MRKAASVACLLLLAGSLSARTITITALDCDEMAIIGPHAPRLSWAITQASPGIFDTQQYLNYSSSMAILMRFPIDQLIPKGQRITKAELVIAPTYVAGESQFHVRRILAEWGNGVCHQYRMVHPKKLEWAQPGGRGAGSDRSNKSTAMVKIPKVGEYTLDVTEDIELWYTKAAANRGWIMNIDNEGCHLYFHSPYAPHYGHGKLWKLQVTFEPQ